MEWSYEKLNEKSCMKELHERVWYIHEFQRGIEWFQHGIEIEWFQHGIEWFQQDDIE